MPTLQRIGKNKVISHHHDVPFKILDHKYGFRTDNPSDKTETHSGNKIIHGDNLEVLKALLLEYEGKIDCIFIDPLYNTGESGREYNDNDCIVIVAHDRRKTHPVYTSECTYDAGLMKMYQELVSC